LYTSLSKLHDKYERDVTQDEFSLYVLFNCLEKDKETFSLLLQELSSTTDTSEIIEDLIDEAVSRQTAYQLALLALEVSEGRSSVDDLVVATTKFEKTKTFTEELDNQFVTHNLKDLLAGCTATVGLRWRLNSMNRALGSLRKGDFGFLFARPETGKTTFLASEASYFAEQAKERGLGPVLWFNNEEQGEKVQLRVYQATFGVPLVNLATAEDEYYEKYNQLIGDHFKLYDSAAINRRVVEQLCEQLQPSLILFDQLDKLKGFSGDLRDDLRLGEIYSWARELAKQYCPVIGVSQSDASGEGKRWLTMDNVANAKTAKQAEADWILGIGKTHDTVDEYTRFLCLSKNKLIGDLDTDPLQRHGKFPVSILPEIARYGDID
jgi:hypothetical protein